MPRRAKTPKLKETDWKDLPKVGAEAVIDIGVPAEFPCSVAIAYDKPQLVKTDVDKYKVLDKAFIALRDHMDEVKERINAAELGPLIGRCARYVHRNRETNKIERTDYWKLIRAEGYQAIYFNFTIDVSGAITVTPELRDGPYVVKSYEKITPARFDKMYQAVLDDLKYHQS